jgi:hypothetical protein
MGILPMFEETIGKMPMPRSFAAAFAAGLLFPASWPRD